MDRLKGSIPENTWLALQALEDAYPGKTGVVLEYLDEVTRELAKMTEFICEQYRHRDINQEWLQAKKQIEKACSLLGMQGEKILANCGPELKPLS
jgi:hypothetical protein